MTTDLLTTPAPIRAPRLTANRLSDLDEAVAAIESEAQYLDDALAGDHLSPRLRDRFAEKSARLHRAADWLRGKVAAERVHRGDA